MIQLKNTTLTYTAYYDRSSSLKELLINLLHFRKYTAEKKKFVHALKNISLTINNGERVGIIGRNGAGKSSLLKVIGKILKPTKGHLYIDGTIQPLIEIAAGFNPEFSGRENIYLNGYMLGFTKKMIKEKEQEIIDFSELREFIDIPVKYYSTGMAVKLAFTIATSIEPEILIFDEMLSAGDAAFFDKAKARMDALVTKAKLVVLVSHDLSLIQTFTTRTLVIDHGQIVFDGPPKAAVDFYLKSIAAEQRHACDLNIINYSLKQNTLDIKWEIKATEHIEITSPKIIFTHNFQDLGKDINTFPESLTPGTYNLDLKIRVPDDLPPDTKFYMKLGLNSKATGAQTAKSESHALKTSKDLAYSTVDIIDSDFIKVT